MLARTLQNAPRENVCKMDFLVAHEHRHWRDNWRLVFVFGWRRRDHLLWHDIRGLHIHMLEHMAELVGLSATLVGSKSRRVTAIAKLRTCSASRCRPADPKA